MKKQLLAVIVTGLCLVGCQSDSESGTEAGTETGSTVEGEQETEQATKFRVYVGTYTNGDSQGIYQFDLDVTTGKATDPTLAAEAKNPSFVAIHPSGKYLYSVSEVADFDGKKTGGVSAYAIAADSGALTLLNSTASGGRGPCHLVTDQAGKNVLVANYGEGSIACIPIKEDGSLEAASSVIQHEGSSVNKQRQAGPHAHSINLDAENGFAFAADLGLDKVLVYGFDGAKGTLDAAGAPDADVPPGSGPRHFAFHPSGKYAYVINEMLCTVTGFSYDADAGKLTSMQTISTLPGDGEVEKGFSTAEIVAHPSGKFLYGSNRGHDSIAIYTIDENSGKLTHVGNESTQGKTPRNFALDPTGAYLLAENQGSGTIVLFGIDQDTGKLTATGQVLNVANPVCIRMIPIAE